MNEELPFDESTLSADDLAVLRAFDAIESWETYPSATNIPSSVRESSSSYAEEDDMLPIFLEEVGEDISGMLDVLQQLIREDYTQPAHFVALKRLGHKMRGTAGAMGYPNMSEVASHIEIIAEQVVQHMLQPATGGKAISHAVDVLEFYLYKLVQDSQEPADATLIANLRSFYTHLSIDLDETIRENLPPLPLPAPLQEEAPILVPSTTPSPFELAVEPPPTYPPASSQTQQEPASRPAYLHVGTRPFDDLIHHSEKLLAQHASIANAYKQVETAFQDLQSAQARFQHFEMLFSTSLMQERLQLPEDLTSSSLITRIFNNATAHDGSRSRRSKMSKVHPHPTLQQRSSTWDELDIEHYPEKDMLLRSLREAMAHIDACSTRLKAAYHTLHRLQQDYMMHVTFVRNDALLMRLAPLNTIIPQLREVVMTSVLAKEGKVDFEVTGDCVEVDQEVLSSLAPLLVHMLQTNIDNATTSKSTSPQPDRVWLHAHVISNEVSLEIGFSMSTGGGTLQALREQLRLLNGSISLARNTVGGISFFLRFPRIHGLLQCLLVRVADQQLLIPLSHVERVGYTTQAKVDSFYHLGSLLGIPTSATPYTSRAAIQQVVFMHLPGVYTQRETLQILVDEIIDETELIVRPLKSHLQRPGITGSTINGQGDVLLLLDIAELVSSYGEKVVGQGPLFQTRPAQPLKILVAEDSTSFRNSILQTLSHTTYQVAEARDGLEALELLKLDTPDILLLDIEMPYLTGYDLLDILRHNSQFSTIKVIMLTSRTSEKHFQHALALGAHAYLTKPSPPEDLLATIQKFLPPKSF